MTKDTIFTKKYFIDDDEKFRWLLEVEMLLTMCYELAEWLNGIFDDEYIAFNDFFDKIKDGVVLCKLGNFLQSFIKNNDDSELSYKSHDACSKDKSGFHSRSNISIFIEWCKSHIIHQSVLFDSKDCFESPHDGKRRVIICLWYLARIFGHYGAPVPQMVAYEILKNKPDQACVSTYLEYKSNNPIKFDVYETMKTQMPDIDIEDYKKKVLIEQEKQQLAQINEQDNNIDSSYSTSKISTSEEDEIVNAIEDILINNISIDQPMNNHSQINSRNISKESPTNFKRSHSTSPPQKARIHIGGSFNAFDRAQMDFRGRKYHILISPHNRIFVRIGGGVDSIEDFITYKTRIIKQLGSVIPEINFKIISDNLSKDRMENVTQYISTFINQTCYY